MKTLAFILLLILILPSTNALGNTFELDFSSKENYPILMNKGDRVLFEYGGYNHTIILDDLKEDLIELDVFMFLESGPHTPNYVFLDKRYSIRLDFDRKDGKELSIEYGSVDLDNQKAMITFRKLEAWDNNAKLTPFWEIKNTTNEETDSRPLAEEKYYFIAGGILFALIILFIIFMNRKDKETYF